MVLSQQLILTGVVFVAASASFAGLVLKDRKPRDSFNAPLLPTTPLLMLSLIVALFALMAILYLLGFNPNQRTG